MGIKEIKEFIFSDEDEQGDLTDKELESIVLVAKVDIISANAQLSPHHSSVKLDISIERLAELASNNRFATDEELKKLNQFVEENQMYL